jgi:anti-sigma factor RsiW
MQRCEHTESMSLHLDGLLDRAEARRLQTHLAECEACRFEWEAMCFASSMLEAEPRVIPALDFTARVTALVAEREAQRARVRSGIGVVLGSLGLWVLTGLSVLAVVALVWQPSWYIALLDLALPLARALTSTLGTLGNALLSVLSALSGGSLLPLVAYAAVALVAATLWTRIVLVRWSQGTVAE